MFAGNFPPRGWALCDGTLLAIASNTALFSVLGTTYGGDGQISFALPDLRGRVPMHPGTGPGLPPRTLGESGGRDSVTLTLNNLPAHSHSLNCANADAKSNSPVDKLPGVAENLSYSESSPNAQMNRLAIGTAGGSQPVSTVPPFQCVNYIIATQGVFPSRE